MQRRVLVSGASGFLGRYIVRAWRDAAADVVSLSRSSQTEYTHSITCDLRSSIPDLGSCTFDTVIHCAGKVHVVPRDKREAAEFFSVNVEGTRKLLTSLENLAEPPKRIIFISSVAVYGKDEGADIDETSPLNGKTPYAESKIQAEDLIAKSSARHNIDYFSLRLPLVVGYHPPGNLGRMAASIRRGTYIRVRNNHARKSMVLASDVARLTVCLKSDSGMYNLTDDLDPEFRDVEDAVAASVGKSIRWQIPRPVLKSICDVGSITSLPVNNDLYQKITSSLTFSSGLAVKKIGWRPRSCLDFIRRGGLFER